MSRRLVPWVVAGLDLRRDVLELGPGQGAATRCLLGRAGHLTCVEIDEAAAARLRAQMIAPSVTVVCGDATDTSLPAESFDTALCFSMLHHVPSVALQDRLFAEVARLVRPGGVFAGFDICGGRGARLIHAFDTMVPVDPGRLPERLERAGFASVEVDVRAAGFRFRARRPEGSPSGR